MRTCICETDMEFVGSFSDGRYWCPKCGRYSQSYACEPTRVLTPEALKGPFLPSLESVKDCLFFDKKYPCLNKLTIRQIEDIHEMYEYLSEIESKKYSGKEDWDEQ